MIRPSTTARAIARVQFDMDKKTALWLKALMQNPIYDDESEEEAGFRKEIFYAILKVDCSPLLQAVYELDEIPF